MKLTKMKQDGMFNSGAIILFIDERTNFFVLKRDEVVKLHKRKTNKFKMIFFLKRITIFIL